MHFVLFMCLLVEVPDLFDLVFKSNDQKFDNVRWGLFEWMFEFGLEYLRASRAVHKKYFAVLITIKYLLQVIAIFDCSTRWNIIVIMNPVENIFAARGNHDRRSRCHFDYRRCRTQFTHASSVRQQN